MKANTVITVTSDHSEARRPLWDDTPRLRDEALAMMVIDVVSIVDFESCFS
jgi:hypothetical protein